MKGVYENAVPDPDLTTTAAGESPEETVAVTWVDLSAVATFDRRDVDGCAVLGAAGEIDVSTASAFRAALVNAVEHSEHLVVDLSSVTFLDCAGLSALAAVVRRVRAADGTLHLVGVNGLVGRIVTLTRLDEVVVVDASVEDALASITPHAS